MGVRLSQKATGCCSQGSRCPESSTPTSVAAGSRCAQMLPACTACQPSSVPVCRARPARTGLVVQLAHALTALPVRQACSTKRDQLAYVCTTTADLEAHLLGSRCAHTGCRRARAAPRPPSTGGRGPSWPQPALLCGRPSCGLGWALPACPAPRQGSCPLPCRQEAGLCACEASALSQLPLRGTAYALSARGRIQGSCDELRGYAGRTQLYWSCSSEISLQTNSL